MERFLGLLPTPSARLGILIGLLLWVITTVLVPVWPAYADIHVYHEQPGQTTLRSRLSLRDQNDLAWQVTLFKRYRGGAEPTRYLRLVGFPGQVIISPEENLQIQTGTLLHWEAGLALDEQTKALPANVAQYQVDQLLADLQNPIPLILVVPLKSATPARLVVPPFVVQEWLQLNTMEQ